MEKKDDNVNSKKESVSKKKIKSQSHIDLGKRIKSLRIAKGYTNYEYFAYDNKISRSQYGKYENGEDLRFSSLIRVVEAFEMTLEEFFSEGFDQKPKKRKSKKK
jgi:transcriptional regulator with XRE-family HTH domain